MRAQDAPIAVILLLSYHCQLSLSARFEMFAWTNVGPDVCSTFDPSLFAQTVDMAANQGVYNLFLAFGLIWSLFIRDAAWRFRIASCFLGFVAVAGLTAAITIGVRTGLPQLAPALLALGATAVDRRGEVEG